MIKLTIEAIEVIDAIARKGSFAAAADALFKVPSALTYTVKKLEQDLGVKLFDRNGHRATLTEAGAELLKEGRLLLDAAQTLESRVKRVAKGVETEINIAVSDLFNPKPVLEIIEEFYSLAYGTRVKLMAEVFGGCWDALLSGRADISLGAPGDAPPGGGYATKLIGQVEFVFAVAPHHPLAAYPEPLSNQAILQFRSVAAADSSRNLAPRTAGILSGQDVLSVWDMRSKILAQKMGLGVGYLTTLQAQKLVASGELVIKQVAEPKTLVPSYLAWRNQDKPNMGKAQQWLVKQFEQLSLEQLLA